MEGRSTVSSYPGVTKVTHRQSGRRSCSHCCAVCITILHAVLKKPSLATFSFPLLCSTSCGHHLFVYPPFLTLHAVLKTASSISYSILSAASFGLLWALIVCLFPYSLTLHALLKTASSIYFLIRWGVRGHHLFVYYPPILNFTRGAQKSF